MNILYNYLDNFIASNVCDLNDVMENVPKIYPKEPRHTNSTSMHMSFKMDLYNLLKIRARNPKNVHMFEFHNLNPHMLYPVFEKRSRPTPWIYSANKTSP